MKSFSQRFSIFALMIWMLFLIDAGDSRGCWEPSNERNDPSVTREANVLDEHDHHVALEFDRQSSANGKWSDPSSWQPHGVPRQGERVLIREGDEIVYDVDSDQVIRLIQIAGKLTFSRELSTELNVALIKVQNSTECTESGFACDFPGVTLTGEPSEAPATNIPSLEIGTWDSPIPADVQVRIRLHYIQGMIQEDVPAIVCCSASMEIHGASLDESWCKLARSVEPGSRVIELGGSPSGWKVGDEVIITASERASRQRTYRGATDTQTESRVITSIDNRQITLDDPLEYGHSGEGAYRSEVANLTRNIVIESADPEGVRGHTLFHSFSRGNIRYARFAHLGKEGVPGRYAIHFHLVGDTMRGSMVEGVSVVDSHNRWITIHGTNYLTIRDCIGYQSVGHGYFMEDGTETYNVLDGNLGVQAYRGSRLPEQVLPFDPNDGAAFWWANGRNTLVNNVACENDEYGFRYDMQNSRYFDSTLRVKSSDGSVQQVDVRTIPIWRFENNESHSEGLYGVVIAANGNRQPDSPIRDQAMLERIQSIDWTGPDHQHPHRLKRLKLWNVHYALRPHVPNMLMEDVHIHKAAYGIYRPAFGGHVYRDLTISHVGAEPFNRGMDDASAQLGPISVDGLHFETGYGNQSTPLIQISDNDLVGDSATYLRHVSVHRPTQYEDRWPLINRGVGPRIDPITNGVPIYLFDWFGKDRHAMVVSDAAMDLLHSDLSFESVAGLSGDEALVAEVSDLEWPTLLEPIDDAAPATMIHRVARSNEGWMVEGISHDDGEIESVIVNGSQAEIIREGVGVVEWACELEPETSLIEAYAIDSAGNRETSIHQVSVAPQ